MWGVSCFLVGDVRKEFFKTQVHSEKNFSQVQNFFRLRSPILSLFAVPDSVFLKLVTQSVSLDSEQIGSMCFNAFCFSIGTFDQHAFDSFELFFQIAPALESRKYFIIRRVTDTRREVFDQDLIVSGKHDAAFDHILEFPDISRPAIIRKGF